ncbi:MAG: hypothetical protein HC888_01515 [Candidatus Competibacteraceae bacterium]|nr:hypothetical protein [Candidatus Competibacteraceae bacterium]
MDTPVLMRRRRVGGGSPAVDYEAAVEALLSGTPGFVIDPTDASINFTDTAGSIPVSSPGVDTVARFNTKFGTTVHNCQNAVVAGQYLWNGNSYGLDGVDDLLQTTNATWPNGMTALTYTVRALFDDLTAENAVLGLSTAGTTTVRLLFRTLTTGGLGLYLRRLDADAQQDFITAGSLVTQGAEVTLQFSINYLNGAVKIFVDGVEVLSSTLTGTDGVNGVSATNSARWRDALNSTNTLNDWLDGKQGRQVMAVNQYLTGTDLTNCQGWVEELSL